MLKQYIIDVTKQAIKDAVKNGKLGQMTTEDNFVINSETPKNDDFGDFAVNVSSLARNAKMAPPMIAQTIAEYIKLDECKITTVAGFINIKLGTTFLN